MNENDKYCAALVREADRERYLAVLFAPADRRDALFSLYAFDIEISRIRDLAREPMPGEIRLQWWREVLEGGRAGEAAANPVAGSLLATLARHRLAAAKLTDLVEARRFDIYDEPMPTLAALQSYASSTAGAIFDCATRILGEASEEKCYRGRTSSDDRECHRLAAASCRAPPAVFASGHAPAIWRRTGRCLCHAREPRIAHGSR